MIAAVALGVIALLLLAIFMTRRGDVDQDKLGSDDLAVSEGSAPDSKCGSRATYELIKREIFRQAADTRGSDQAAFDRIAASASVRMERPVLTAREESAVRCSGYPSLDLPPGLAVVGGRRTLSAQIKFVVQPAADGSGDVVMIEGADPIIVPLATLATVRGHAIPPVAAPDVPSSAPVGTERNPPTPPAPPQPSPASPREIAPQASVRPSFNCGFARTRGEVSVCRDPGLASLDRQMASQYSRAISSAGRRQQAVLRATRDAFLRYRDRCGNDVCIAGAYRDRMREIDDIMAGRWRPGR